MHAFPSAAPCLTRAAFGHTRSQYRFLAPNDDNDDGSCFDRRVYDLHPFTRCRLALSAACAPSFEALLLLQKACLVLCARLFQSAAAQGTMQAIVYAAFALLCVLVWPCQRLDARMRYLYLPDALNWAALLSSLVPLANLVVALAADGRAAAVLGILLTGLNALFIALLVAAWAACALAWRRQSRELAPTRLSRMLSGSAPKTSPPPRQPSRRFLPSMRAQAAQLLSGAAQRWRNGPQARSRRSSAVAPLQPPPPSPLAEAAADPAGFTRMESLCKVLIVDAAGAEAAAAPADAVGNEPPSLAMRSMLTPPTSARRRSGTCPRACCYDTDGAAAHAPDVRAVRAEVTPPASKTRRRSSYKSPLLRAQLSEEAYDADDDGASDVTAHWLPSGGAPPADAGSLIVASGPVFAALLAAGLIGPCDALARRVEASCVAALAALRREREAALRVEAHALVASSDDAAAQLQLLFRQHGFEAWLRAGGLAHYGRDPGARGAHVGYALVACVVTLLAFALGLGLRGPV
jgi:hypothetical protein